MKFLLQALTVIAAGYVVLIAVVYFFQEKMMFLPDGRPFGECPDMKRFQADAVVSGPLRYYIREKEEARMIIIHFHGNAGSACDRIYYFDLLDHLDASVILAEYPGYGGDGRIPGQDVLCRNAEALVRQIRDKNDLPVFLLGESIGTGVAVWAASRVDVAGLILISSYSSMKSVAQYHYPWMPVGWLLKHQFDAGLWAKDIEAPVLMIHGADDDIIPIRFAVKLYPAFTRAPVMVEIEGSGHNDILFTGRGHIREHVDKFTAAAVKK